MPDLDPEQEWDAIVTRLLESADQAENGAQRNGPADQVANA